MARSGELLNFRKTPGEGVQFLDSGDMVGAKDDEEGEEGEENTKDGANGQGVLKIEANTSGVSIAERFSRPRTAMTAEDAEMIDVPRSYGKI